MGLKRILVPLAAAACLVALPLAACTSNSPTASSVSSGSGAASDVWIAKNENSSIPEGVYRYYLTRAYVTAANNYRQDYTQSIFDQEIDGQPAADWIREQALTSVKNLLMVNDLMKEYGLTISADDALFASEQSESYWNQSQVQQLMQSYGITKEDIKAAQFDFEVKNTTVFEHIYSTGDKAISDAEIERYLKEHYTSFRYVLRSTYDSYESLPDEELEALRTQFKGYATSIQRGSMTIEDAAKDLAEKALTDSANSSSAPASSTVEERAEQELQTRILDLSSENLQQQQAARYPEEMLTALREMKNGEVRTIEAGGFLITMVKDDINSVAEERLSNHNGRREILVDWKGAEYSQDMEARMADYTNFELNDKEIERDLREFFEPADETSSSVASTGSTSSGQ